MNFPSGAVGNLHLAAGHSHSGPRERYELVFEKGHMVCENNVRLTVYRPGYPFDYRKGSDFTAGDENVAALIYEPQNTLSTLDNKAIFIQGFVQELEHFSQACLSGIPPTCGTLQFARAVMECYEAGLLSQGRLIRLDDRNPQRSK
jgi:predicted dehydrogenase